MIMNQENFEEILSQNIDIIAHYHISNPNLTPLNHPHEEHKKLGNIVKDI